MTIAPQASSALNATSRHQDMSALLLAGAFISFLAAGMSSPANAQTPAEAYGKGCGGCHTTERTVMRRIPKAPEPERRAWIETFMAQHPCERDDLKPLIVDYLLDRSRL